MTLWSVIEKVFENKKCLMASIVMGLCQICAAFPQNGVIRGRVTDAETDEHISGATVSLKNKDDNRIVAYCVTMDDGSFSLNVASGTELGNHFILVSCLGYADSRLECGGGDFAVRMVQQPFKLKEVSVEAAGIVQDKDTVSYYVSSFVTKRDRTIGDVLSNMPGINVAENGKISYNGMPISKFYIEGIDLLDGKYNIATDNLSHKSIARVDIWENHQSVKALKGSGVDTETAVNLKLRDDSKGVWSGSLSASGGRSDDDTLWEGESFAARFSSLSQSVTSLKSNNSGKNIKDEVGSLTLDDLLERRADGEVVGSLKTQPSFSGGVDADRTRLNRTHVFNTSNSWKLSEDAQIRAQLIYTDDRNRFDQSVSSTYFTSDSILVKQTQEGNVLKDRQLQASVKLTVDKHSFYLSDELSYSSEWTTLLSDISGDTDNTSESSTDTHQIRNRLKYVKRFNAGVLWVTSSNSYTYIPEKLMVIGESDKMQAVKKKNFFSDTRLRFVRLSGRWSFDFNMDILGCVYSLESNYRDEDTSCLNDLKVWYVGGKVYPQIVYQTQTLRLSLVVPLSLYRFDGETSRTRTYFKPEINVKWKFLPRWAVFLDVTSGSHYSGSSLYYTSPIMTDYRTMSAGLVDFSGKQEDRIVGRLSYANTAEMLFFSLSLSSSRENNNTHLTKKVEDGRIYYSYISGGDIYRMRLADGSLSKGLRAIRGKVELKGSYYKHSLPIEQNGQVCDFDLSGLDVNMRISSSLTGWMDVNYKIGYGRTSISTDGLQSVTSDLVQNLSLTVYPLSGLNVNFKADHYLTTFDSGQKKSTFLADVECMYKFKDVDLYASCKNVFNQKRYSYNTYSDLSSTLTGHSLRGRNALVGVVWHY